MMISLTVDFGDVRLRVDNLPVHNFEHLQRTHKDDGQRSQHSKADMERSHLPPTRARRPAQ